MSCEAGEVNDEASSTSTSDVFAGYLLKQSGKGPLKAWRRYWFVVSEQTGQLTSYKSSKDLEPTAYINLARASFTYDAENESERPGVFKVIHLNQTLVLDAGSEENRLNWLHKLQQKRRRFSLNKTKKRCCSVDTVAEAENIQGKGSRTSNTHLVSSHKFASLQRGLNKLLGKNLADDADESCSNSQCSFCREHEETIRLLREELLLVENKVAALSEVKSTFHVQASSGDVQTYEGCDDDNSDDSQGDLETSLLKLENKQLKREKRAVECEVEKLREDVGMYVNVIRVKDELIVTLTDHNQQLEGRCEGNERAEAASSFFDADHDASTEYLQEKLGAFKEVNDFLNNEIVAMNELIEEAEQRDERCQIVSATWEAKYYQVQSKYLYVMDKLKSVRDRDRPEGGGPVSCEQQEVVAELIEDAMAEEREAQGLEPEATWVRSGGREKTSRSDYTDCGFIDGVLTCGPPLTLTSKADTWSRRAESLQQQLKHSDISLIVKWENYLLQTGDDRPLERSSSLKSLIRQGIPTRFRGRVWRRLIDLHVCHVRQELGADYYEDTVNTVTNGEHFNPYSKQIELDLLRTLPNNRNYSTLHSDGVCKLRRVLLAFSAHNPKIGYCQGLNRLVAIALLFLSEEDAFWCLVCITEFLMPADFYSTTLLGAQADQRVLKEICGVKLPRLHQHLAAHKIDMSYFTFQWFLTVFVDNIPVRTYLRIWDAFLYEGDKVLFRFALGVFRLREAEILALADYMAIYTYCCHMGEGLVEDQALADAAFTQLNPFPHKLISSRRNQARAHVLSEIQQFTALKEERVSVQQAESTTI